MNIIYLLTLVSSSAFASSPAGSQTFEQAVKGLAPLGKSYAAAEASLLQQGYRPDGATEIKRSGTDQADIQAFGLRKALVKDNCAVCGRVTLRLEGRQRTSPPGEGERDVFTVDTFSVSEE
jgi:hypothetical protein